MTWKIRQASDSAGAIASRVAGAGPVVALIHGVGLCGAAWQDVGARMAVDHEVHLLDMPGHGGSPLGGAAALSDYVGRIEDYLGALAAPVVVVGHSMGAMVALELAARRCADITGVVAVNAIFRRNPDAKRAVRARADALSAQGKSDPEPTLLRWFGADPQGHLQEAADACRRWLSQGDPAGYKAAYRVFAHHDGPPDSALQRLDIPAAFITGGKDPNSTPQMSHAMAALCPRGQAHVMEDAAHMLPMTHVEATAALLRGFCTSLRQEDETDG